jgi:hypothetical protein
MKSLFYKVAWISHRKGGNQMKFKGLAAVLVCLAGAFCARAPQEKSTLQSSELSPAATVIAQESISYDNLAVDVLWATCKKTLNDMNVAEYRANNEVKRILAVMTKTTSSYEFADYAKEEPGHLPETIRQTDKTVAFFYLLLMVDENKGGSVLTAKVAGQKNLTSRGEGVLKSFLGQLAKNLKK